MKLKLCYHPCAQEHGDVVVVAGGDLDHGGIPNLDGPAIHRRHPERQHGRVHHGLQHLGQQEGSRRCEGEDEQLL